MSSSNYNITPEQKDLLRQLVSAKRMGTPEPFVLRPGCLQSGFTLVDGNNNMFLQNSETLPNNLTALKDAGFLTEEHGYTFTQNAYDAVKTDFKTRKITWEKILTCFFHLFANLF